MFCSPVRDTAQVLAVTLGIPGCTILVPFHMSMCLITTPSWEMCLYPLPSCLYVPLPPASNSFSDKKEKKVTQEVACVLIICVQNFTMF